MSKEPISRSLKRTLFVTCPILSQLGFYLAGGTAVALHLAHRRSVDLDWFTPHAMPDPLALAQILRENDLPFETTGSAPGTLHGTVLGVRVTLLEYHYPLLAPLVELPQYACQTASLADLACMKLAALVQRGAKKDFIDIYAIGKSIPLEEIIRLYRNKYRVEDTTHILRALCYFDEADREKTPPLLWETGWREMKKSLRDWISRLS